MNMGKSLNMWKLNNTLLKKTMGQKNHKEIRKYLETNENKNTTHKNLCDAAKAALKGNFIAINVYIKKISLTT